jgi:hypothetical protein
MSQKDFSQRELESIYGRDFMHILQNAELSGRYY